MPPSHVYLRFLTNETGVTRVWTIITAKFDRYIGSESRSFEISGLQVVKCVSFSWHVSDDCEYASMTWHCPVCGNSNVYLPQRARGMSLSVSFRRLKLKVPVTSSSYNRRFVRCIWGTCEKVERESVKKPISRENGHSSDSMPLWESNTEPLGRLFQTGVFMHRQVLGAKLPSHEEKPDDRIFRHLQHTHFDRSIRWLVTFDGFADVLGT